jgi:hypothetical protein
MRRHFYVALASLAVLVAVPAIALAHGEHHRGHEKHHRRDRAERRRDRIEHFREHGVRHERIVPGKPGRSQDIGTVQSFNGDVLVIALHDGSTVSGRVDRKTKVDCKAMDENFQRDDGGPSGGDHHGRGDDNGDDNGSGDDDGGNNANCLSALQTVGTHVRRATLSLTGSGAFWDHVDLDA